MKAYRRLLGVTWKEKKTNEWVWDKIKECCRRELEEVVDVVKRRKFRYFGHLVRGGGLEREMMEGKMEGRRGVGRPPASWGGT